MIEMGDNQCIQMYIGDEVSAAPKKRPPRRNPWGNSSYADLITQAIETSPEKKLTLSQIYDWMIRNVPHFSNQGASNSSAGWKNSIRHNLSLHEKFLRIKNEDTNCKSSWWTVNKSGGTGRTTRRKNLSRRKKSKNIPPPPKSNAFFNKFSFLNSTKQFHPSTKFDSNLQNIPNPSNRRWQSCSSYSSEENESLQSVSTSNSPSSIEGEILHRDSFNSHSSYTPFNANERLRGFLSEFNSSTTNAYLHMNSDNYNYNHLNANGVETYYSLGNKFYPHFCNQQNPSSENYLTFSPVEETSSSTVSREYFKSPHHLSGSYMTSEFVKTENIQSSALDCEKSNLTSIGVANLQSQIIQRSQAPIDSFELNHETSTASNEAQALIQLPIISQNPEEIYESVNLDSLNQNQFKDACFIGNLNESQLYLKKEVSEESEEENNYSRRHLEYDQESTEELRISQELKPSSVRHSRINKSIKLKCNLLEKENNDDLSFNQIIIDPDRESVSILYQNIKETEHKVQLVTQSTSSLDQNNLELLDTGLTDCIGENLAMGQKSQVLKFIKREESNVVEDRDECIGQQRKVKDEINEFENCDYSQAPNDYNSPLEDKNANCSFQNESCTSNSSEKITLQSHHKNVGISSLNQDELQEKDSVSSAILSQESKHTNKRKDLVKDIDGNQLTLHRSKRQKLECSETKFMNTEDIAIDNTSEGSAKKERRIISFDIKNEVNTKVKDLLFHMVNLVLQKVKNVSCNEYMVDYTLNTLYHLSESFTPKQLLSILVEFSYALDSTIVYQFMDTQRFHSYNRSLEILLRSQNQTCSSLKDVIDLYFQVISAVISVYFSEKVLSDSRIKDMDFPPDMNLFLLMYQAEAISAVNDGFELKLEEKIILNLEREYNLILPSVCPGANTKSLKFDLDNVDDKDSIQLYYEFLQNRDCLPLPTTYHQCLSYDIPQNFLDALDLKRINRVNNCTMANSPQYNSQNIIEGEKCEPYNAQIFSLPMDKVNRITCAEHQNIARHFSDSIPFEQGTRANYSLLNDNPPQNELVQSTVKEYKSIKNCKQNSTSDDKNDFETNDTLPEDLRDIDIKSNFSLTQDYLDFEFLKYDFDFDEHLKEIDIKNR